MRRPAFMPTQLQTQNPSRTVKSTLTQLLKYTEQFNRECPSCITYKLASMMNTWIWASYVACTALNLQGKPARKLTIQMTTQIGNGPTLPDTGRRQC